MARFGEWCTGWFSTRFWEKTWIYCGGPHGRVSMRVILVVHPGGLFNMILGPCDRTKFTCMFYASTRRLINMLYFAKKISKISSTLGIWLMWVLGYLYKKYWFASIFLVKGPLSFHSTEKTEFGSENREKYIIFWSNATTPEATIHLY